jgi:translocation and assembly module TamA
MRCRWGRFAACLIFLLSCPVAAEGLRYQVEGASPEARDNIIAYLGEQPRDESTARGFVVSAGERAGHALEALGIYDYAISVDVDRSTDPWRATVVVEQGEAVGYSEVDVSLVGEGVDDPALQSIIDTQAPVVNESLHHGRYEALKQALMRRARELGYFDATFAESEVRVDVDGGTAAARLVFATGARLRFGAVSAPDELLSEKLLVSLLPFGEGDFYEQAKILELRSRLLRLGFFNSVVVLPDLAERDSDVIPIVVELQPAPQHSYEVGVGFSTDTRERLSLSWHSPRLNRYGHSQKTILRYSPVNPAARLVYSVPLDDPARDLLQFGARLENNEFGDLESEQREVSIQRETSKGSNVRSIRLRALDESWEALAEGFDASYLLAGGSYSRRTRAGNAVDPSSGLSQFYELELASSELGSDQDILRLAGTVTALTRIGERSRIVGRVTGGVLFTSSDRPDELPPSLAFFAGGDNSIRGYAYQSIGREIGGQGFADTTQTLVVGGTRLLTASLEYQRYLFESWRAAVFVDAGDAFVDSDFNLNVGVGIGLHYLTPVGAIRIEIANPVSESDGSWRFHINIGAEL